MGCNLNMCFAVNVVRADHERDGSIRSGRTMESPRWICGGVRQTVVTEEQRYGPRWLCVNDDITCTSDLNFLTLVHCQIFYITLHYKKQLSILYSSNMIVTRHL